MIIQLARHPACGTYMREGESCSYCTDFTRFPLMNYIRYAWTYETLLDNTPDNLLYNVLPRFKELVP